MMSSEPSDQNREPVTRRLDELAQQVKYLRELIDAAYAEERRQYSAFFPRPDRRKAPPGNRAKTLQPRRCTNGPSTS
jgi:hypothetical protein